MRWILAAVASVLFALGSSAAHAYVTLSSGQSIGGDFSTTPPPGGFPDGALFLHACSTSDVASPFKNCSDAFVGTDRLRLRIYANTGFTGNVLLDSGLTGLQAYGSGGGLSCYTNNLSVDGVFQYCQTQTDLTSEFTDGNFSWRVDVINGSFDFESAGVVYYGCGSEGIDICYRENSEGGRIEVSVPEPTSLALMACALMAMGWTRRKATV